MKKLTTEQFINKAREIHGDLYDYSLVEYKNNRTKVKIICKEHGIFEQNPRIHYNGGICRKCAYMNLKYGRFSTEEFIVKAQKVHGNVYDYSLSNYLNCKTKIKIICRKHGIFEQRPNNHLNGQGCMKCGLESMALIASKSSEKFIKDSIEVHGDLYDYSLVNYKKCYIKVKIICKEHGTFEQKPNNHLSGQGCSKCGAVNRINSTSKTTEEFIERAKKVHGDLYDYSLVDYKNSYTKVKIICNEHGVFEQRPNGHLQGLICKPCSVSHRADISRKTTEDFIKKSREVHGNLYDYNLVDYRNNQEKVKIICKEHGVFNLNLCI